MPSNRQTVVTPLGLILSPNPFGQYPAGALSKAENALMRVAGEIWQAPTWSTLQFSGGAADAQNRKIAALLDAGHAYTFYRSTGLVWGVGETVIGSGSFNSVTLPSIANTTSLFLDTGQIWPVRARERFLVNTATCGVFVGDSMAPSTAADRALRSAGMPQPNMTLLQTPTNAGTIPASTLVGYSALLKRVFADNYQVVSVPSPVLSEPGVGSVTDVIATVTWSTTAGVVAGDIVELYRTDGLNGAAFNADPGETLKLVMSYTLTASDITAGQVALRIQQIMSSPFYQTTGRELYTNPGQETALQANRQPNIAGAMAKFKTFTFFGDITERPAWTFTIPAGIGLIGISIPDTPFARQNAIGVRTGAATITTGSNTITGVSAANLVGIVQGQVWTPGAVGFATGTTVSSVGASTIVMSANANANGTLFSIRDVFILDGVTYTQRSETDLLSQLQTLGASKYEITTDNRIIDSIASYVLGTTYVLEPVRPNQATITIKATNGANYQPPVPEFTATAQTISRKRTQNLLQWSKDSEPEHVPPSNETNVGTGTIIAMAETKNALWLFCSDGLYRLSGDAPPWRVDLMDPNLRLVAPQAWTVLRDVVFAYVNYGIVAITDSGIEEITVSTLNSIFPGPAYSPDPTIILERNEVDDEIIATLNTGVFYVFNTKQKAWTTINRQFITTSCTALAFQRSPASGVAPVISGTSVPTFSPFYGTWLPFDTAGSYVASDVRYQPLFGEDPLVMKQYIDETLIFSASSAGVNLAVLEGGAQIASGTAVVHGDSSWSTNGFPRSVAIALLSSPGFTTPTGSTPWKFRGISQRYALCTNQAWRK